MKKLLAALLAVMLMMSAVAFAEEATTAADLDAQPIEDTILNFDITMDQIPEGYTMSKIFDQGVAYVTFSPENGEGPTYMVGISADESVEGIVLPAELGEEEQEFIIEAWCGDWNAPTLRMLQTAHGTNLIVLEDNDAEGDVCDLVTCYNGYIIVCDFWQNGELTEADVERGVQILSDMWIAD